MKKQMAIILKEDGDFEYVYDKTIKDPNLKNYKIMFYNILRNCVKLRNVNDSLLLEDDKYEFNIFNYSKIDDKNIRKMVKDAIPFNVDRKKKDLRGKKIRRIAALGTVIVISSSSIYAMLKRNENSLISYVNDNFDQGNEVVDLLSQENIDQNVVVDNLVYEGKNEMQDDNDNEIIMNYEDRTNTPKYLKTKKLYSDKIKEIANQYGLDYRVILGIATQECGVHVPELRGPARGLMQIEKSVWVGNDISAFNYQTNKVETVHITDEKLKNLDFNIKVACMIFQNYLKKAYYNIPAAIQMYNYGPGNIKTAINNFYGNKVSSDKVLKSKDYDWLQGRENVRAGDKQYLEHILSYIEDTNDLTFRKGNETVSCSINKEFVKKI